MSKSQKTSGCGKYLLLGFIGLVGFKLMLDIITGTPSSNNSKSNLTQETSKVSDTFQQDGNKTPQKCTADESSAPQLLDLRLGNTLASVLTLHPKLRPFYSGGNIYLERNLSRWEATQIDGLVGYSKEGIYIQKLNLKFDKQDVLHKIQINYGGESRVIRPHKWKTWDEMKQELIPELAKHSAWDFNRRRYAVARLECRTFVVELGGEPDVDLSSWINIEKTNN